MLMVLMLVAKILKALILPDTKVATFVIIEITSIAIIAVNKPTIISIGGYPPWTQKCFGISIIQQVGNLNKGITRGNIGSDFK